MKRYSLYQSSGNIILCFLKKTKLSNNVYAVLLQDIGRFCCSPTENDGYVVGDVPAHAANYTFHPTLAPLVPPSNIFASNFFVLFFGS
jgi:hypothetical protein